jgi:hypothetical protein
MPIDAGFFSASHLFLFGTAFTLAQEWEEWGQLSLDPKSSGRKWIEKSKKKPQKLYDPSVTTSAPPSPAPAITFDSRDSHSHGMKKATFGPESRDLMTINGKAPAHASENRQNCAGRWNHMTLKLACLSVACHSKEVIYGMMFAE